MTNDEQKLIILKKDLLRNMVFKRVVYGSKGQDFYINEDTGIKINDELIDNNKEVFERVN